MGGPGPKIAQDSSVGSDSSAPETAPAPGAGVDAIKAQAAKGSLTVAQAAAIVHSYLADAHAIFQFLQQQPQFGNNFVQKVLVAEAKLVADEKIKQPTKYHNRPESEYVITPETPKTFDPLAGAVRLDGSALSTLSPTTPKEAEVLNAVRGASSRFDPTLLADAQTKLKVAPTGSFDVETLRALRADKGDPALGEPAIMKEDTWTAYHAGTASMFAPIAGGIHTDAAADITGSYADHCAQSLGYKNYDDYAGTFQPFTFLGVSPRGDKAHPHLIDKLKVAEQQLRTRFPKVPDNKIAEKIGWQKGLVSIYGDALMTSHMHTMGLAVDFDAGRNPYVYPESDEIAQGIGESGAQWWTITYDVAFAQAAQLFQGVTLSRELLVKWSKEMSSEELHAHVKSATAAIHSYIELAETKNEDKIHDQFLAAGFSETQFARALPDMLLFPDRFKNNFSRNTSIINTQSVDLVVALRDGAGLAWGGTELDPNHDNGDFMHFDCRNEGIGAKVMQWNNSKKDADTKGKGVAAARLAELKAAAEAAKQKHP
jgi:hypothetical protein